jgi:hypothetical protein
MIVSDLAETNVDPFYFHSGKTEQLPVLLAAEKLLEI